MIRFMMVACALALPAALTAQEPVPRDTTRGQGSEPVFLSADSVAKLRAAAADSSARGQTAESAARARAAAESAARIRAAVTDTAARAATPMVQRDTALAQAPMRADDRLTQELGYTPQPGNVWLASTSTTRGGISRGVIRGPDGRLFARPSPDDGVWMVVARDPNAPRGVVTAPVGGVVREESAGEVAPALSTSVRSAESELSRADIRELQGAMTDAGCTAGRIDGAIGPQTRRAMACVQRKYALPDASVGSLLEALNLRLTSDTM